MTRTTSVLAVVPLRLESTRIPQKMLAKIGENHLCLHSVERASIALKKQQSVELVAAVDSPIIQKILKSEFPDLRVEMTSPEIPTGTDRVFSVYQKLKNESRMKDLKGVLNIQGDMPFMGIEGIQELANYFIENDLEFLKKNPIATLCQKWPSKEKASFESFAAVKILRNKFGFAIYFSRQPIPYSKVPSKKERDECFISDLHIGAYGFEPSALSRFCAQVPTELELAEGLEQLRALYLGYSIFGIETAPGPSESYRGIDTPQDLKWARAFLKDKRKKKK
jgi:3-deoxy-manno-octulosonate cytidylyltransferase (CMP-KDO synthetase)